LFLVKGRKEMSGAVEKKQNATLTVEVANSQKRIEVLSTDVEAAQKAIQALKNDCKPHPVFKGWKAQVYKWLIGK
jgi:hypothetical protein